MCLWEPRRIATPAIKDYNGTTNPAHMAAGFPTTCATCHSTTAWAGAVFNHNNTPFPLTGAHTTVPCASCHVNNVFAGTPTDCYSCHTKDYTGTTNPAHRLQDSPPPAQPATRRHLGRRGLQSQQHPLPADRLHATVPCASCHINNVFMGTPTDCYSCHTDGLHGTNNPNHVTAGFPTSCATCHTTTSWAGAVFNHNNTPFPLTGAHTTVPCTSCHINNVFAGTPTDCYSCHKEDFTGTNNPPHKSPGFPTTCATCHTTLLGKRDLQSQQHALPADRRPYHGALRELPHQ